MPLQQFTQTTINDHACYMHEDFLIVQNDAGTWNAYRRERDKFGILTGNSSSVQKIVIRQEYDDEYNLVDVMGAAEYTTPDLAAEACI